MKYQLHGCILHEGATNILRLHNNHLNFRVEYCTRWLSYFQSSISGDAFEELFTVTGDRSRGGQQRGLRDEGRSMFGHLQYRGSA